MPHAAILFFDGECNLCNSAVQFVIRHDKAGKVKFAALQSPASQDARAAVMARYGRLPDSLIFFNGREYLVESAAALGVAALLDGGWKWIAALKIFPRVLRDWVYRGVAKRRFKWFGKRDSCMMPTPELQARFISF